MEYIKNKSLQYHQAKKGILADGIFCEKETYDSICGLIIFYLTCIKENKNFPDLNLIKLQEQKNYLSILKQIKEEHFHKINHKDIKIFMTIFMTLELSHKPKEKRGKI